MGPRSHPFAEGPPDSLPGSQRAARAVSSAHREGLLGLLDAPARLRPPAPGRTPDLQGRHLSVQSVRLDRALLGRHRPVHPAGLPGRAGRRRPRTKRDQQQPAPGASRRTPRELPPLRAGGDAAGPGGRLSGTPRRSRRVPLAAGAGPRRREHPALQLPVGAPSRRHAGLHPAPGQVGDGRGVRPLPHRPPSGAFLRRRGVPRHLRRSGRGGGRPGGGAHLLGEGDAPARRMAPPGGPAPPPHACPGTTTT